MIKSRFIRLYQSLNKAELKQLKRWVVSPTHNLHQDVAKLFDFLESRSDITKITVQKKRAFHYIFPKENYQEDKLRHLMNYALNLLKEFVGYNRLVLDQFNYQYKVIQELRQRKMPLLASRTLEKLKTKTQKSPLANAEKSFQLFELERENFQHKGTQNRTTSTNLPHLFQHLTNFYVLSMLKYACTAISHSNVSQQHYTIPMLDAIVATATNSEHPTIQLYLNLYYALATPNPYSLYFETASQLFFEHHQELSPQEQSEVLLLLINYCIKRLNTNAKQFVPKAFDFYKWGIEKEVLLWEKTLSRFAYMNIVSLGLKLKAFDWVAAFIPQYVAYLPTEYQENYQHYTTAKLHFNKKEYQQAQRLLIQVEYDDIFLNLDAKTTLLEIHYEEKNWDALDALLQSFSRYLQRKQVLAYHKQVYQNIIMLTRKMMALLPYDKVAKQQLIHEIKTTNPLAEREWLLKQANLL